MATYKYKIQVNFDGFGGNSNSYPRYYGDGCVLLIVATATTDTYALRKAVASALTTGIDSAAFQITGRTGQTRYELQSTSTTVWCAVAATRPGASWKWTQPQQLSQYGIAEFDLGFLTMVTGNIYVTYDQLIGTGSLQQGDPYYKRQAFDGWAISGLPRTRLLVASSGTQYWDVRTASTAGYMSVSQLGKRYTAIRNINFHFNTWHLTGITEYVKYGYDVTVNNGTIPIYVSNQTSNNYSIGIKVWGLIEQTGSWELILDQDGITIPAENYDQFEVSATATSPFYDGISQIGCAVTSYPNTGGYYEFNLEVNGSYYSATHISGNMQMSWYNDYPDSVSDENLFEDITVTRLTLDITS